MVQKVVARSKKLLEHFNKSRPHREELERKQDMLELHSHKLIQVHTIFFHGINSIHIHVQHCEFYFSLSYVFPSGSTT